MIAFRDLLKLLGLAGFALSAWSVFAQEAQESPTTTAEVSSASVPEINQTGLERILDDFNAALDAGDGEKAASMLSAATVEYYEKLLGLALTASEKETKALDFLDKMLVVQLRHAYPAGELRSLRGSELYARLVEDGFVEGRIGAVKRNRGTPEEKLERMTTGDVKVDGARATLNFVELGPDFQLVFLYEDPPGKWLIDLLAIQKITNDLLETQLDKSGVSPDSAAVESIATKTGKQVRDTIWQPLVSE